MIQELLQQFMSSPQASAALQAIQQQHGLDPATAQKSLHAASEGTAQALAQAPGGGGANPLGGLLSMLGGGAGGNAVAGALSGMLGGGGLGGAVQGGLSGVVVGRVAEMIASRTGMNPQMASAVAASLAPHILSFLHERGAQAGAPAAQPQAPMAQPQGPAVMQPIGGPQYGAPQQPKDPGATKGAPQQQSQPSDVPPWKRVL